MRRRQEKTRIDEIIGKNIVVERKSRKMTRDELAELMELTTSHMGLIERGERGATAVSLSKLSNVLEIPIDSLFASPNDTGMSVGNYQDTTPYASRGKIQSLTTCLAEAELDFIIHIIKGIIAMNHHHKG